MGITQTNDTGNILAAFHFIKKREFVICPWYATLILAPAQELGVFLALVYGYYDEGFDKPRTQISLQRTGGPKGPPVLCKKMQEDAGPG